MDTDLDMVISVATAIPMEHPIMEAITMESMTGQTKLKVITLRTNLTDICL